MGGQGEGEKWEGQIAAKHGTQLLQRLPKICADINEMYMGLQYSSGDNASTRHHALLSRTLRALNGFHAFECSNEGVPMTPLSIEGYCQCLVTLTT